jgi:hypothetical protein
MTRVMNSIKFNNFIFFINYMIKKIDAYKIMHQLNIEIFI